MGYQVPEFIWTLPPSASYEEVDRLMRQLQRIHRWQRWADRIRRLVR